MSQVRKLQPGGTPETPEKKIGSITIDGKKYDATPEIIQALSTHISRYGDTAAPLGGLTNALLNGEDVVYDSASNTITGMQGKWAGVDERTEAKRASGKSNWRRQWDAWANNDSYKFNNALRLLSGFYYTKPKTDDGSNSNLINIYGNEEWFKFDEDENGNKVYSKTSGVNPALENRITYMLDYLGGDAEKRKGYKLGDEYNDEVMSKLQALYNSRDRASWDALKNDVLARVRSGRPISSEDETFLRNFFIVKPNESEAQGAETRALNAEKKKLIDAGYGNDLIDALTGKVHLDNDGSLVLNDGESWGFNFGNYNGRPIQNLEFNDSFYDTIGADGSYDPYRGLTLYNNRLYSANSPTLKRILDTPGGYNELMRSGDWAGAQDIILTNFKEDELNVPSILAKDQYSEFLSNNPNLRFSDLTGLVTLSDPSVVNNYADDDQIIQYVDLNSDEYAGPYRRYKYNYALLDRNGKLKTTLSRDDLKVIPGGTTRENGLETHKRVVGTNNRKYNGKIYQDVFSSDGKATGIRVYRDPKNPNGNVILHMPAIKAVGIAEDTDFDLPPELANTLMSIDGLWDKVTRTAQTQKDFVDIMSKLVQSRFRREKGLAGFLGPFMFLFDIEDERKFKRVFGNDADKVRDAINKAASKGSRSERQYNYTISSPYTTQQIDDQQRGIPMQKNGGLIKLQRGGFAKASNKSIGVSELRTANKSTNPKNAAGIVEVRNRNWTEADTLDMTALVADLASLTTAFVPGANIASVVTGAGGSTARFAADLQRGTKGAIPNYLLNLGMDATMLLPVLGGMGKIARIPNIVRKSLPTIIKAASVYGLGAGVVDAAKKIASGQKFTVRDVDMLVNALTAGVGLTKQGGFGKSSKTTKTKAYSEEFKIGETNVKLGDSEIKQILKSKDQPKALRETIKEHAPNASDKEIADAAEKLLKEKQTIWQRIRKKDGDIELNVKKKPLTNTETKETTGNLLHDWWYKTGKRQQVYNGQLQGQRPTKQEIVLPEGSSSELMYLDNNLPAVVRQVPDKSMGLALPQWINPFTSANNQSNYEVQPSGVVLRPVFRKQGGKIVKHSLGTYQGGINPTNAIPDFATPILNGLGLGRALSASKKQLNNDLNIDWYNPVLVVPNAPKFVDSGQGTAYDNAAKQTRLFKNVYADATSADAMKRQRDADSIKLQLQGDLARSQEFGQYINGLNQQQIENTKHAGEVLNQIGLNRQNKSAAIAKIWDAYWADVNKNWDAFHYATTDWLNKRRQALNQQRGAKWLTNEHNILQSNYLADIAKLNEKYNGDLSSDMAKAELNAVKDLYKNRYADLQVGQSTYYMAKGGSVSRSSSGKNSKVTYSRDPYPDLLLQNQKAANRFVEKLNDNTIKLILSIK